MQKICLILLCAGLFCVQSYAEPQKLTQEAGQPDYAKLIQPQKLKENLDFLFKTIEEVHPNMYAYISKSDFERYQEELYKNINEPKDKIELYKLIAPVICQLRFGHCNVFPPRFQEYQTQGKSIPLSFDLRGKDLIVIKNLTKKNIPESSKIIKVNNRPFSHKTTPCRVWIVFIGNPHLPRWQNARERGTSGKFPLKIS